MEPGIYPTMTHAEYHAVADHVSNSYLSRLNICPAAAKVPQTETPAMLFGKAFHSYVLDGEDAFYGAFAVIDIDRRTKAGKAAFEAFCEAHKGKDIIARADLETILGMDAAIKTHPVARNLLDGGMNEVSIFWVDPFSRLPCKARPDHIFENVLVDLKKTRDASERGFTRSIITYGYHRQAAFYCDGMTKLTGKRHDTFAFIAVEDTPPHRIGVYTLSEGFMDFGRNEYQFLMARESRCRADNEWPNYTSAEVTELELPRYLAAS
jgi:hypothetical protein